MHKMLQCPAHDQARRDILPGQKFSTDPRRLWDFFEGLLGADRGGCPPHDRERERERERAGPYWPVYQNIGSDCDRPNALLRI